MVAEAMTLPEDYGELRKFTNQLLAEIVSVRSDRYPFQRHSIRSSTLVIL